MIAFHSGTVLDPNNYLSGSWVDRDSLNYLLSVKSGGGYCISKVLVTSLGVPFQLTLIVVFDSQADIIAIPELLSSAFIPWRSPGTHRLTETSRALLNSGLCEEIACAAAIALDIIYDVIDCDFIGYSGAQKECLFTSSGMIELNEECRERIFSGDHVTSDCPFVCGKINKLCGDGELPF